MQVRRKKVCWIECVANKIIFLEFLFLVVNVDILQASIHSIQFHSIHVSTKYIRFRADWAIPFHFILFSIKLHCTYMHWIGMDFCLCDGCNTSAVSEWTTTKNSLKQLKMLAKSQNCMIYFVVYFLPSASEHT